MSADIVGSLLFHPDNAHDRPMASSFCFGGATAFVHQFVVVAITAATWDATDAYRKGPARIAC